MGRRRAGIVVVVVAVLVATPVAGAKKHKKVRAWGSKVTLAVASSSQFKGRVSSKLKACRNQRVVNLYFDDPSGAPTVPVGVARTNKKGNYVISVAAPAFSGTYHAELNARKIRAMKRPQKCKAATSPRVTV
jgi:hypothetical protein